MAKDRDKVFQDAYKEAYAHWQDYIQQGNEDIEMYNGDQWPQRLSRYLREQGRDPLVFNRIRRVVQIVTGYERKNRLSLTYQSVGGEDDAISSQLTKLAMVIMGMSDGHEVISDAFKIGSCVSGSNLVEIYPDRESDIQFARWPHTGFLLDPTLSKLNLSDCDYVITAKMVNRRTAANLVPTAEDVIKKIEQPTETNSHFNDLAHKHRVVGDDLMILEYFWERKEKDRKYIVNRSTGQKQLWTGTKQQLDTLMQNYRNLLTVITKPQKTVELTAFYGGHEIFNGIDPYGIQDLPFQWFCGYFVPEAKRSKWGLQSLIRSDRDPQIADNMRLSQMIDIFETQVHTGDIYEESALLDPEDAFKAGQGQPLILKDGAIRDGKFMQRKSVDIPAGMFNLHQILDKNITEIPGINDELFGTEDKDIPGVLSKLRQGGALTVLQELFDNLRLNKRYLGRKIAKMIQANYSPKKVLRILNEPPAKGFYQRDFAVYDCIPVESMLTDTQRQMAYAEVTRLKEAGAPVPWSLIFDLAPIQLKQKLKDHVSQAEQSQQKAAADAQKMEMASQQLLQAEAAERIASARTERAKAVGEIAKANEDNADAGFKRAKTIAEIDKMKIDSIVNAIEKIGKLENMNVETKKKKPERMVRR